MSYVPEQCHITRLDDLVLMLIFDCLPLLELMQVGRTSKRWHDLLPVALRRRKSLFLQGQNSRPILRSLHFDYGLTYSQLDRCPINPDNLTAQFARKLSETFSNITRLEIALSPLDHSMWFFLKSLLEAQVWKDKLTNLKIILGGPNYFPGRANGRGNLNAQFVQDNLEGLLQNPDPEFRQVLMHDFFNNLRNDEFNGAINHNDPRLSNHAYYWNNLLQQIISLCGSSLKHLTLYDKNLLFRRPNSSIKLERLGTFTSLDELFFGVQCQNQMEIIIQLPQLTRLQKFAIIHDWQRDRYTHRNIGPIQMGRHDIPNLLLNIDHDYGHKISEIVFIYSESRAQQATEYFQRFFIRFPNITRLHLLLNTNVRIEDLFAHLEKLPRLASLRLSDCPEGFFITTSNNLPHQLKQVTELHIDLDNSIQYETLKSAIQHIFPILQVFQISYRNVRNCDLNLEQSRADNLDQSIMRSLPKSSCEDAVTIISPQKQINVDLLNLYIPQNSKDQLSPTTKLRLNDCHLPPLEKLFSVLFRHQQLIYLRMNCVHNYFHKVDKCVELPQLTRLTTLHLDLHYRDHMVIDNFDRTSTIWPNLEVLKIDALNIRLNCFELTPNELSWFRSLSRHFPNLRKVFLIIDSRMKKCSLKRTQNVLDVYRPSAVTDRDFDLNNRINRTPRSSLETIPLKRETVWENVRYFFSKNNQRLLLTLIQRVYCD